MKTIITIVLSAILGSAGVVVASTPSQDNPPAIVLETTITPIISGGGSAGLMP